MLPVADGVVLRQLDPMLVASQPEPPWIKRCTYGVKFTDEIQVVDDPDFSPSAEEKKEPNEEDSDEVGEEIPAPQADLEQEQCAQEVNEGMVMEEKREMRVNSTGKIKREKAALDES